MVRWFIGWLTCSVCLRSPHPPLPCLVPLPRVCFETIAWRGGRQSSSQVVPGCQRTLKAKLAESLPCHGVPRCAMVCHGVPRGAMVRNGVPWCAMASSGRIEEVQQLVSCHLCFLFLSGECRAAPCRSCSGLGTMHLTRHLGNQRYRKHICFFFLWWVDRGKESPGWHRANRWRITA